nr:transposase [Nostoc mirabile]
MSFKIVRPTILYNYTCVQISTQTYFAATYFVASCGGVTVSTLRKYIEAQETPTG